MPKNIPPDLLDRLSVQIQRYPGGISASQLHQAFAPWASPRTILRLLGRLLADGRVVTQGKTRALRYLPAPPLVQATPNAVEQDDKLYATGEIYVPLTGDSPALRDAIRRPAMERQPVGYDRTLLDAYEPNRTVYLSDADRRARLHQIGRAPTAARVAGTYARDILGRLLIDLSWASSHLEGNTYTRLDTQALIEHGKAAAGKDQLETQMILNHKQAIEFLVAQAAEIDFDGYTFMNLHALLSQNLLRDPADEGRLRTRIVEIGGTVYRPLQVPQQIEELFDLILQKAGAIADPFEQAFFLMVHIPYLQPFADVNKRVSRLAANIPFIRGNLCPLSFVDVPERAYVEGTLAVYEYGRVDLLRDVFLWAYERSCQNFKAIAGSLPEPDPFRLKYREELKEAVGRLVRETRGTKVGDTRNFAANLVPVNDQEKFTAMVSRELNNLHEGNIARYGLRLADYRAWRASLPKV